MQYGVILPNVGPMATIENLERISRRAEDMGYSGVFLSDHIAVPSELRSAYPYRSDGRFPLSADDLILEPITALAYLAAVTARVHLGFSVLILPYRHPVLNAKMLATLDVISGGRLILGAGVGWMAEEFVALDADYPARGAVTDQHIATLRALWTNPAPGATVAASDANNVVISPKPVQAPHPPIWTGGISPPALRRAANLGDGWHGVRQSPGDVARVASKIAEMRLGSGRTMDGYEISLRAGVDVSERHFPGEGRTPLRGSADQISDDLDAYAEAGLTYLVVEPRASNPDEFVAQLEKFAAVRKP